MQRLVEGDDGDAQARFLGQPALDGVDVLGHAAGIGTGGVVDELRALAGASARGDLEAEDAVLEPVEIAREVVGDHEELAEFFLRGHAPQKVLDPPLDGQRGVAVGEGLAGSALVRAAADRGEAAEAESPENAAAGRGLVTRPF